MLKGAGLYNYFELLVSNQDISKPKPDPEMYLYAMGKMGVCPEEVVIVEDAPHGVEAAQRAGAYVCQVSGFDEVDYYKVKNFIDNLSESTRFVHV
jgi:HAD superfamily hydrolase (TIGR01509 family)